ncbi:MAG: RecQ family ATP-dependent DNA helicase [Pirellulaceae bacterium]
MSLAETAPESIESPAAAAPAEGIDAHLSRFNLTSFRPGQREVISAVIEKQDCLCIMPTGGGKSLCYQLPAVMREGLTLVVSPLIALMKDQVDALQALGIAATFINSSLTQAEQRERMEEMAAGKLDLVYIAPERLRHSQFLEKVRAAKVHLLAVDEAHCISEWGHDFRPDYARLGRFRERLGWPQTIALTATATPKVRDDVAKQLQLRQPKVFITGFARANLRFEVQEPQGDLGKYEALRQFLEQTPGAGIIYAATRKRCEEIVETLREMQKDRKVGLYHAGLMPEDRRRIQDDFMEDRVPLIVATNAFGMGIDKPDLRFVIHFNMPGSLEAYYQEAGRAGRDGLPSRCLLLFSQADRYVQEFFIDNKYPPREAVKKVYDYLRRDEASPIELTLQEIKDGTGLSLTTEGIASCEKILEKAGVLERLDSRQNQAAVRIDSDLPTLVELLPQDAPVQRKVMRAIENIVGEMRHERVFLSPATLGKMTELDASSITRAVKELCKLKSFDYVPPFRGRAIHMLERTKQFAQLGIDFAELDRRKGAEYEKLERVIGYARAHKCRQVEILDYFGDPGKTHCGNCDNCRPVRVNPVPARKMLANPAPERKLSKGSQEIQDASQLQVARMILSAVARTKGRVGKGLVAKMLFGSKAAEISKLRLDRLSTYGLLAHLKRQEIAELIDSLQVMRLVEQVEEERFRPTVQLTPVGEEVMRGTAPLPGPLTEDQSLILRIRQGYKAAATPAPSAKVSEVPTPHVSFVEPEVGDVDVATDAPKVHIASVVEPEVVKPQAVATIIEQPAVKKEDITPHSRPNHYWTWQLLSTGYTAEECQAIRRISEESLQDHLLRAARDGLKVDPRWILSPQQWQQLTALFGNAPAAEIQPLLSQLPEGLRYRDVQFYLLTR